MTASSRTARHITETRNRKFTNLSSIPEESKIDISTSKTDIVDIESAPLEMTTAPQPVRAPQNNPQGFRRWEDKAEIEEHNFITDAKTTAEMAEHCRRANFRYHKELIYSASYCNIAMFNERIRNRSWYKPLRDPKPAPDPYTHYRNPSLDLVTRFLSDTASGLPYTDRHYVCTQSTTTYYRGYGILNTHIQQGTIDAPEEGYNIFTAIFVKNKTLTPQEKITVAEELIETQGYIHLLSSLFRGESTELLNLLGNDRNYIAFLLRIFIQLLRETTLFNRHQHKNQEKWLLERFAAYYNHDGGIQLFENLTANNNLSTAVLTRYLITPDQGVSWPDYLESIGLHAFLNKIREADSTLFKELVQPKDNAPINLESMHGYIKAHMDRCNNYDAIINTHTALTAKLHREPSCTTRFDHVVKKYAHLRILQISLNSSGHGVHHIPDNVKKFLNPREKNPIFLSGRSAYKLVHTFFTNPNEELSRDQLTAKEQRTQERLSKECKAARPK